MNYKRIYDQLIDRAKNRVLEGYKERHHIIPKCLGGTNKKENLADLTAEEHYLAHQLLVRIHPGERKLVFALNAMYISKEGRKLTIREFGWIRRKVSEETRKMLLGTKASEEAKKKMSEARKGKPSPLRGVTISDSHRENLKKARKKHGMTQEMLDNLAKGREIRLQTPMSENGRKSVSDKLKIRMEDPELKKEAVARLNSPEANAKKDLFYKEKFESMSDEEKKEYASRLHSPESISKRTITWKKNWEMKKMSQLMECLL